MAEETVIEMSEGLQNLVYFAFDEAKAKLADSDGDSETLIPFTVLADDTNMFIETHPGDEEEERRSSAANTVYTAADAVDSYVFCYDGYVDTDDGMKDVIVVEAAEREDEEANAFGFIYALAGDEYSFEETPVYLGTTPSLFASYVGGHAEAHDHEGDCDCGCEDE